MKRITPAVLGLLVGACTEAGLYQWKHDPYQANKLTVSGTVCTDDPRQRNFPVKILFIVDVSNGILSDQNDQLGYRGKAIDEVVATWGKNPNYHFGIIAYGGKARSLIEGGFTQDSAKIEGATALVSSAAGVSGCIGGRCRDLRSAMSLANSIVSGDVLAGNPGVVARTTYVLVLFAGGPPVPALGRCACRDKQTETLPENWQKCPWTECDGCKCTCPANTRCQDTQCFPICTPGCSQDEFCDTDFVCKRGSALTPPSLPCIGLQPPVVPDTYTQWVLPAKHSYNPAQLGGAQSCGPQPACVFPAGGRADSCEERTMVALVREMKDFVKKNGAGQLQLHATYLADKVKRDPTDPFAPPCNDPAADEQRSIRLLSEMAFTGGGGFIQFPLAQAISFRDIDLHTSRDPLVIKELVVTNANVLSRAGTIEADTDQDGLSDDQERELGTCASDPDTDGDGISDGIEVKLATKPNDTKNPNYPIECVDLPYTTEEVDDLCAADPATAPKLKKRRYQDLDKDGLNACEERLLGTLDTLMDSDADGIPDKVELIAGTNYLSVDPLQDADFDGVVNREEIRGHSDPRSNDSQSQLDLSYRYEEVDEGIKTVLSISQPPTITGVFIKNLSANSGAGVGYLKFDPGPPATLSWRDPGDNGPGGDYGPAVDVSQPSKDGGYKLTSCSREAGVPTCSADSQLRFMTVNVDPKSFPPKATVDRIIISSAQRNCLRFRVRNITLLETGIDPLLKTRGNNTVYIYFSQAPQGAKDSVGIFRVVSVGLNYLKGPPETRTPKAAELNFADDDFALFE